jgi:hypothetical protein
MRATGHGISAGIGKLGAFIGVFLFPVLSSSFGLRGTLLLTAGVSVLGMALTFVLPEPARRSLEDMPASPSAAAPRRCAWPARHRPREDLTPAYRHVPGGPVLGRCLHARYRPGRQNHAGSRTGLACPAAAATPRHAGVRARYAQHEHACMRPRCA